MNVKILFTKIILFLTFSVSAQPNYTIHIDTFSIAEFTGVHSYAYAQHDGKILIIGGRVDGLHGKFNAFSASHANKEILVLDPTEKMVWKVNNESLPISLKEQMQSNNAPFIQDGDQLLYAGGYGESESQEGFITYPYLTIIDVPNLIHAVINEQPISPHFQQIKDDYFAVTGGNIKKLGDTFYLVGGHLFEGEYASGWSGNVLQIYTDAIRKFKLDYTNGYALTEKIEIKDEWNLHRRDYNLVPQVMPDETIGLTIFSGVFQPGASALPYLNLVNITETEHQPVENFNQYLTQYHTAHIPIYDAGSHQMQTLFFGGMSQYVANEDGILEQDNRIPFTNIISRISRNANGEYAEYQLEETMPYYVGTSSEFILDEAVPTIEHGIIDYAHLTDTTFLGYIVGGIRTPADQLNPYTDNNTAVTAANAVLIKVSIAPFALTPLKDHLLEGQFDLDFTLAPNPATTQLFANTDIPEQGFVHFLLQNGQGKLLKRWEFESNATGAQQFPLNLPTLPSGLYQITANVNGKYLSTQQLVLH